MTRNIKTTILAAAALTLLGGCEKEKINWGDPDKGQLNCKTLTVDYINSGRDTRAGGVDVDKFTVDFINTATGETARSFLYAEMPEVVALPVGNYRAEAHYGDNPIAAWEEPYYLGASDFQITAGKITDVDPVECALSNIRIRVNISDNGTNILGDDVKVTVRAGEEGELTFDSSTNDKAGYFRYVTGSKTITATLSCTIDGQNIESTQAYDNAQPGNAYTINFTVNKPDNMEPGTVTPGDIEVDATITIKDENHVIDPNEPDDSIIEDDMRPVEGGKDPVDPDDPKDPENPDDPKPSAGPQIIPLSEGLILDQCCVVSECRFKVTSESGITAFKIRIDSEALPPEELEGIGLAANLDLINPGQYKEPLVGFGFAVGDQVENQKEVEFDITDFLGLLRGFGPMEHKFHLTVTDADGTKEGFIGLKFN